MIHDTPDHRFTGRLESMNAEDVQFFCAYSFALTAACESLSKHLGQDRDTLYKKYLLLGTYFVRDSSTAELTAYLDTLPDPDEVFRMEGDGHA
jgi:hypothetical protein